MTLINIAQPAKGQIFQDPLYKTPLVRLTDQTDGQKCFTNYSYWSAFSCDSKHMIINCDDKLFLYNIDPLTLTFNKVGPTAPGFQPQGCVWSASNPDVLAGLTGWQESIWLREFNTRTGQMSWIHDFTEAGELPRGNCGQLSKARNNDRFYSFHFRLKDNDPWKYVVIYDRQINKTFKIDLLDPKQNIPIYDEAGLDRFGKKLIISTAREYHIFSIDDFTQHAIVAYNADQRAGGHSHSGDNILIQADLWGNTGNKIIKRVLSDSTKWVPIWDSGVVDWTSDQHICLTGPDDTWALISIETRPANYSVPFCDEIFLVKTDGSGQVIHLAQSRSSNSFYEASPFANMSLLGDLFCFNSDWGTGKVDVYVGKIPTGTWGTAQPPVVIPPTQTRDDKIVNRFLTGSTIGDLAQSFKIPSTSVQDILRTWMIKRK